jgi:hypothetical protein
MMLGESWWPPFGTLHTLRSPSEVCVASMSVFCLEDDPCHAKPVIRDGLLVVVRVCKMVNDGCKVATSMEPFKYPMAKVLQSLEGAIAVIGSKMVRAEICSDVDGSNMMMLP